MPGSGTELEEFFDLSIDLLCIVGFDGYFKRVNPSLVRTLGYPKAELLSRPVFDITHPDDIEPSREALSRLAEGHDLVAFESRVVCADGSVRMLEWNTRTTPERRVVYGVARDTTERRRAEAERRQTQCEQAALRRVATLIARETPPDEVFAAVAREVGEVLDVDATHLGRYDAGGTVVSVAQWGRYAGVEIGARFPIDGDSVSLRVLRTGCAARMDGYAGAPGTVAARLRELGIRFSVGVPISVGGRTWGVMIVTSKGAEPFPAETESRLQDFTDLLATAITNAAAHEKVRALAEEQAALRRVATLVARQAPQAQVFGAIAEEIGRLLSVDTVEVVRFEDDRVAVVLAAWGPLAASLPTGTRTALGGHNIASLVFRTGRAARLDDYGVANGPIAERMAAGGVRSALGTPIVVEGRVWGAVVAAATHDVTLPADTDARIAQLAELTATAIANAEARTEVTRLAEEQAALRRVATLVAQGAAPAAVFDAVTAEAGAVMDAASVTLARYDDGDVVVALAHHGASPHLDVGQRVKMEPTNLTWEVRRTGRAARRDHAGDATGEIAQILGRFPLRTTVATPVVVDGRTWGVLAANWIEGAPADDAEDRMARFAELLDTAIANADSRDQLTASRARVLAAGDDARRRVVRDLHDGAQQRLMHTIVTLKLAQRSLRDRGANAERLVAEALENAERATAEVRELAHGILPSAITRGGLRAGVDALLSRLGLPVDADVSGERLPPEIEASAYFIVAEALTNVVKHARATRATVRAAVAEDVLTLEVRDDGVGGADPEGHGLVGIGDRVDALGGRLRIESVDRGGTLLTARLPLSSKVVVR